MVYHVFVCLGGGGGGGGRFPTQDVDTINDSGDSDGVLV